MPDARRAAPGLLPVASRIPARAEWAPVFHFVGIVLCCLAALMLVPAMVDLAEGNSDYLTFFAAAAVTGFVGASTTFAFAGQVTRIGIRGGVVVVLLTWVGAVAFGALPFAFAEHPLSLTDAVFEAASGLTATGSTLHVGLDQLPRGILLWRFLLSWMGGFGLVTFAVLILPQLRIGGLQLFTVDLSARPGKFLPRTAEVVASIAQVYVLLTAACAIAYGVAGMSAFDAIGHAMATVATAGVSSHDSGLGFYQSPAIEWIATLFMLLGAMPFVVFLYLLRGKAGPLLDDSQVRLFVAVILLATCSLALWRLLGDAATLEQAFREAAFNVVSILSTTGFVSHDFHAWGGFASLLLLCAMLMGGCTGSTAGGIKMFRVAVLLQVLRVQIRRQIQPNGIFQIFYSGQPLPAEIVTAVVTYAFAYLVTFSLLALALAFTGLHFDESLGAAAAALSSVGLGLGARIGPCCTFEPLSDLATWLLTIGMIVGRLEILLFVLPFTRGFWRA